MEKYYSGQNTEGIEFATEEEAKQKMPNCFMLVERPDCAKYYEKEVAESKAIFFSYVDWETVTIEELTNEQNDFYLVGYGECDFHPLMKVFEILKNK